MNQTDVVLFGTSKIAQVVYAYIRDDKDCGLRVAGFCVDAAYYADDELFGLPVVRFEDAPKMFAPDRVKMLVAIGYHGMNSVRAEKCAAAEAYGYELVSYVHSRADVSSTARMGRNCIVLDNVSVEPFSEIGDNVCLYCNATIAHHAKVGDNCWITSGTVVGGNSTIGNNCFLGINSTIGHNIVVGAENFIGAGAVVTRCTGDKEVYIVPDTPKHRLSTDQFMKLFKFD